MLSEDLLSVRAALGEILGNVDMKNAALVRQCRIVLEDCEEQARQMERNLLVPFEQNDIELKEVA